MRRANIVISVSLLAFVAGYAAMTMQLPKRNLPNTLGADFLPWVLTSLLAFLSLLLLGRTLARKGSAEENPRLSGAAVLRIGLLLALFAAYVVGMVQLGFLLVTPPFVVIVMLFTGSRKWGEILITSVVVTAVVYFVFHQFFRVPLPGIPFL